MTKCQIQERPEQSQRRGLPRLCFTVKAGDGCGMNYCSSWLCVRGRKCKTTTKGQKGKEEEKQVASLSQFCQNKNLTIFRHSPGEKKTLGPGNRKQETWVLGVGEPLTCPTALNEPFEHSRSWFPPTLYKHRRCCLRALPDQKPQSLTVFPSLLPSGRLWHWLQRNQATVFPTHVIFNTN